MRATAKINQLFSIVFSAQTMTSAQDERTGDFLRDSKMKYVFLLEYWNINSGAGIPKKSWTCPIQNEEKHILLAHARTAMAPAFKKQ